jgi:hypothetical protein
MTDTELRKRIEDASHAKRLEEEAKEAAKQWQFVDPIILTRRCIVTGKKHEITVEKTGWAEYTGGESLRALAECLPMLTDEEQRLLTGSISDIGFEQMFKVAPDEYDNDEAFD